MVRPRPPPPPSEITPFGQGTGIPSWQNSQNINSPWLARAAVRDHSHYGTDWIKIYETEDYEGADTRSRTARARSCRTAR